MTVWFLIMSLYVVHAYPSEQACAHAMHVMEDQILVYSDGSIVNKKPQVYRCEQSGEGFGA